jgi:hypothetical protein
MVGAVGIENNTNRNSKDLEEMLGSAKELKRNNGECKGILIGPLMAPRFSRCTKGDLGFGPNFAARMANRRPSLPKKRESN